MNSKTARAILARCLPDGPDATSRYFRKAREVAEHSESLRREYEEQLALDKRASQVLDDLVMPDQATQLLSEQVQAMASKRFSLRDPAMLSVFIGFLLLVAVLTWHFLGRAGVFPEDALAIAAEGTKFQSELFEVVEQPAGSLEDWFLLKGFERFHVPKRFANYHVAGVKIFQFEKQPIALLAIPEQFMFFMVFDPVPFGIRLNQGWRTAEFNYKYAAAIREEEGLCFMIVIMGKQKDLLPFLD